MIKLGVRKVARLLASIIFAITSCTIFAQAINGNSFWKPIDSLVSKDVIRVAVINASDPLVPVSEVEEQFINRYRSKSNFILLVIMK